MSGLLISQTILTGGQSQKVALTTVSAQSSAITDSNSTAISRPGNTIDLVVTVDVTCFVRQGENPTAVSDGTDQILTAGQYRISSFTQGNKLAFIMASGTGNAYITPLA